MWAARRSSSQVTRLAPAISLSDWSVIDGPQPQKSGNVPQLFPCRVASGLQCCRHTHLLHTTGMLRLEVCVLQRVVGLDREWCDDINAQERLSVRVSWFLFEAPPGGCSYSGQCQRQPGGGGSRMVLRQMGHQFGWCGWFLFSAFEVPPKRLWLLPNRPRPLWGRPAPQDVPGSMPQDVLWSRPQERLGRQDPGVHQRRHWLMVPVGLCLWCNSENYHYTGQMELLITAYC